MTIFKSILVLLLPLKAMACGLDWNEPVSHFENVDYQGNVHIVRKLGEVEKLPIYLIFNSSHGISPYAGSGFEMPFLESRIWQVDENRFQMKSPSGWLWVFQRTKDPNVLEGNAGWKGLIKDDTFTVWAPCGDKIAFRKGRIVSMQIKEDKFDYAYKNNLVENIWKNGQVILEVKGDAKSGEVTGIELPRSRETISWKQARLYPRIETVGTTRVVTRLDSTLTEVEKTDETNETFDFSLDDQKINPTLKIGNRLITWSSTTKTIISDEGWVYDIKREKDYFANAEIGRKNAKGQSECWHDDALNGKSFVQGIDRVEKVRTRFTTGVLAGQPRAETQTIGAAVVFEKRFIYDDKGTLVRIHERTSEESDTGAKSKHTDLVKVFETNGGNVGWTTPENMGSIGLISDGKQIAISSGNQTSNYLISTNKY